MLARFVIAPSERVWEMLREYQLLQPLMHIELIEYYAFLGRKILAICSLRSYFYYEREIVLRTRAKI